MKTLRTVLAATAVAVALVPTAASAGIQCHIWWTEEQVGPLTVSTPHCAW